MIEKPNVLLITVDSLRPDHTTVHGYRRPTTPFLKGMAEASLVFEQAVADSVPTYFSFQVLMSSRFPALQRLRLDPKAVTLAKVFRGAGYRTGAFTAANPMAGRLCNFHVGFDDFDDFGGAPVPWRSRNPAGKPPQGIEKESRLPRVQEMYHRLRASHPWVARAAVPLRKLYLMWRDISQAYFKKDFRLFPSCHQVVEKATEWMRKQEGPFFLWVHLMDTHHPYLASRQAFRAIGSRPLSRPGQLRLNHQWHRNWTVSEQHLEEKEPLRERVIDMYDAAIRDVDSALCTLFEFMRAHGQAERTVSIVMSDHGEHFLEKGRIFHRSEGLGEELIRLFLMVHAPGLHAPRREERLVRLLDVGPWLLKTVGLQAPESFQGSAVGLEEEAARKPMLVGGIFGVENVLELSFETPVKRVFALRGERHKLVFDEPRDCWRLFDLKEDPRELDDLWSLPAYQQLGSAMREELLQRIAKNDGAIERLRTEGLLHDEVRKSLDRDEEERVKGRLADLGYL